MNPKQKEKKAFWILQKLVCQGYKSYYAGGYVRDQLLGLRSKDIDIVTSAKPHQVKKIFKKTIDVGIQFGVVIVVLGRDFFEVSTFRKDGSYYDGRKPTNILFSDEKEDVLRRDFTINGVLYDPIKRQFIDYVGGQKDLQLKLIRAIGDVRARFQEDKLRILRAIRFASRFNYQIEQKTWIAIQEQVDHIWQISPERIRDEISKILMDSYSYRGVLLLKKSGLLFKIFPEFLQVSQKSFQEMLKALSIMQNYSHQLAWATFLYPLIEYSSLKNIHIIHEIALRLRFSHRDEKSLFYIISEQSFFQKIFSIKKSEIIRFLRQKYFWDQLSLYRLYCLAQKKSLHRYYVCQTYFECYQPEFYPLKLINGDDLIEQGFFPGSHFQLILKDIEDAQLDGLIKTRNQALEYIQLKFLLYSKINRV